MRPCCSSTVALERVTTTWSPWLRYPRPAGGSIFYDQQGCGNSDQPDDPERWTVDFYVREVAAVREALGLDRVHILGQSWGGMLLMEYLVGRPEGVVSAVIASSPASMPLWMSETARQRAALPPEVIEVLDRHEAAGTWDDPEYEAAVQVFYDRHLCRVVPAPEFDQRSFAKLARNPQVYRTMNGPDGVPCRGHPARLGDPVPPGRGRLPGPAHQRPSRRGHADADGAHRRRHPAGGVGAVRGVRAPVARGGARSVHGGSGGLPGARRGRPRHDPCRRATWARQRCRRDAQRRRGALTGRPGPARP